ncbi:glycosyltransferase [Maribellus sediminis]|uniref:glycosyltransferase n=1 Tax=Maribellus sediminis TaxID=2696285 RepID=UPI00142F555C|nr:glycosyltransferase [Maribellus sediminis]
MVRKRRKKIVFDVDDAIHLAGKRNAGDRTKTSIRLADVVITSCPVLYNFAKEHNSNTFIITSAVNTDVLLPSFPKQNSVVTIGWIGSSWTTKYLELLRTVFEQLSSRYTLKLLLIGASSHDAKFKIDTEFAEWSEHAEAGKLQAIDIGIMPLFDNEFERAKGGYKLFQYMAAGKPVLASPVGINNTIVVNGENGFLCADEKEWLNKLSYLIEHPEKRLKMGGKGREAAVLKYGLVPCAKKLLGALDSIQVNK